MKWVWPCTFLHGLMVSLSGITTSMLLEDLAVACGQGKALFAGNNDICDSTQLSDGGTVHQI